MTVLLVIAGAIAAFSAVLAMALVAGIIINLLTRVPYAATPGRQVERILDSLQLPPQARLYDLGCGDGRVVFAAARRGMHAVGYELQPLTYLRAKVTQLARHRNAHIRWGDFRRANVRDADCVFCFLVGSVMPQVAQWLEHQLKPGCLVVSYGFKFPAWREAATIPSDHPAGSTTYVYKK